MQAVETAIESLYKQAQQLMLKQFNSPSHNKNSNMQDNPLFHQINQNIAKIQCLFVASGVVCGTAN